MAKIRSYKIRHRLTGMFRKAGGGWSNTGKVWGSLGHVKNHLNIWRDSDGKLRSDSMFWDVVVIEVEETTLERFPADHINEYAKSGLLKPDVTKCPCDGEDLSFEKLNPDQRIKRHDETTGNHYYVARCPECEKSFKVQA